MDAGNLTGQARQRVSICAQDDTGVAGVHVVIYQDGKIIEEGEAVPSEADGLFWTYVTTTDVPVTADTLVEAKAHDLAGNAGPRSVRLG